MDLLNLDKLPAEARPIIQQLMDRTDALEAQSAKDVSALADKVTAAIGPKIDAAVEAVNAMTQSVNQITSLARRIDGAGLTFRLAPEVPV